MSLDKLEKEFRADVEAVQKISIIPTMLDVICSSTGMGFAAVARVTEQRWITCSLLDKIEFGLQPGDELKVETTICHEIRQGNQAVIIDWVEKDERYKNHHTPAMYGFQSYISVPIFRRDGSFFGTLCAIDPRPAILKTPQITGMFALFSDLISFHLQAVEQLENTQGELVTQREVHIKELQGKNEQLQKMNIELESFAHIASHDLQEPLRKINAFSSLILNENENSLTGGSKHYFDRLMKSVKRMQTLIDDLIEYTQVKEQQQVFEMVSLNNIVEEVKQNSLEEIIQKHVTIVEGKLCEAYVIPFQFTQLLQNLIGNAIKFSRQGVNPVITISSRIEKGDGLLNDKLLDGELYCHITIADNGIGFEPQYNNKIFDVFQRLNGREEFEGTGIGLSIVKKIVDNHHGFIMASGELNKGATFDVYIPHPSLVD